MQTMKMPPLLIEQLKTAHDEIAALKRDLISSVMRWQKTHAALKNIVGWIDGQEGSEQIPPRYLIEAHSLLED